MLNFITNFYLINCYSVVVSERTVLTATGSAKRTTSLSRYLTELRTARPSISLFPITIPPSYWRLRRQLGNALRGGYIPGGLKDAIKQDPNFYLSLSIKPINKEAFNYKDKRTLANFALPLIKLTIKLYSKDKWRPKSVINPLYLSRIPNP
ncbi:hypothetical protein V2W45_1463879 [Cenococcum geophilum]